MGAMNLLQYLKREKQRVQERLHLDISEPDKKKALRIARHLLLANLGVETELDADDEISRAGPISIGLALWTAGELRASVISHGESMRQALTLCAERALQDPRFVPIGAQDLHATRIEITILSNLQTALSPEDVRRGRIDATLGYKISFPSRKEATYLPEVFNFRRFSNLAELCEGLLVKSGAKQSEFPTAVIHTFRVSDFIEAHDAKRPLNLRGPIVVAALEHPFLQSLREIADAGAAFLLRVQEESGYIPNAVTSIHKISPAFDMQRLAFTARALQRYGLVTGNKEFERAGQNSLDYVLSNLHTVESGQRALTLAYLGQACFDRGEDAASIVEALLKESPPYDPIVHLHIATFFASLDSDSSKEKAHGLLNPVLRDFETEKHSHRAVLAHYAEVIPVLLLLGDTRRARHVASWYTRLQHVDGSFPTAIDNDHAYARGTAKIFESLACTPNENIRALLRGLSWLNTMQYSVENSFFLRPARQEQLLGGLRESALDTDVWPDAVGHVLLGACRILGKQHL